MATGDINNLNRARQLLVFKNMVFGGNKYPTDIDAFIEYKNKAYVIIEVKSDDAVLGVGQSLALERMCDDLGGSKKCLLVIARHNTPTGTDVDLASCVVDRIRYQKRYTVPTKPITVKQITQRFIKSVNPDESF